MICFFMVSVMASCKEDYEIPYTGEPDGAELLAVGNYTGQWTVTNTSTGEEVVSDGTITITEKEYEVKENETTVKVKAANVNAFEVTTEGDLKLNKSKETKSAASVWNISRNSSGNLNYWNVDNKNPFGVAFNGSISPEGNIVFKYSNTLSMGRGGKNIITYNCVFNGVKTK